MPNVKPFSSSAVGVRKIHRVVARPLASTHRKQAIRPPTKKCMVFGGMLGQCSTQNLGLQDLYRFTVSYYFLPVFLVFTNDISDLFSWSRISVGQPPPNQSTPGLRPAPAAKLRWWPRGTYGAIADWFGGQKKRFIWDYDLVHSWEFHGISRSLTTYPTDCFASRHLFPGQHVWLCFQVSTKDRKEFHQKKKLDQVFHLWTLKKASRASQVPLAALAWVKIWGPSSDLLMTNSSPWKDPPCYFHR